MERSLGQRVERHLTRRGAWWVKTHGAGTSRAGIPDYIVNYRSFAIAIETKTPTGRLTRLQGYELDRFRQAGGIAIVARTLEDVTEPLDGIDIILATEREAV